MSDQPQQTRRWQFSLIALIGLLAGSAFLFWLGTFEIGRAVLLTAGFMSIAAAGVLAVVVFSMWLHRVAWRLGGVVEDKTCPPPAPAVRRQFSLSALIRLMFGFAIFFFAISTSVGRMLLLTAVLIALMVVPVLLLSLPVIGICLWAAECVGKYIADRRRGPSVSEEE